MLLVIATALYTVRLSRCVLWPSTTSERETWELMRAAMAATALGFLLSIALFGLGVPDEVAVTPFQLGAMGYATTLLVRYELAHGPPSVRAAWPMLLILVGVYVAASTFAVLSGRPVVGEGFYPLLGGLGSVLLAAIWNGDSKICAWAGSSQYRQGISVIAPCGILMSTLAAAVSSCRGADSPVLFGLTVSGMLVGGSVVFAALMHPLRPTP
jgi:hypothetical protein